MTEELVKAKRRRPRRHRRPTRPRELPEIFFCGDPHGGFDQINEAARLYRPDAMVILGDLQAPAPVHQVLEEALSYTDIWWIPGNHDTDTDHFYDYLWRSELGGHNLHGRVANICGMRIAGLGGVFRGQVWMPEANPNYYSPSTFMRRVGPHNEWRGGVPRRHRSTIFPSVYGNLMRQKADILITHEAPSCHKKGFLAIDKLAKSLGAKWLFHGHQHEDRIYENQTCGITTRAVGYRGVINLKGEVVISSILDPREEAVLNEEYDLAQRREQGEEIILVRDEDGVITLCPPQEGLVPAILPAVPRPVITEEAEPREVREKTEAEPVKRASGSRCRLYSTHKRRQTREKKVG